MKRRWTDTDKWQDPWFRGLSSPAKLLWMWICDRCDDLGVLQADWTVARSDIGEDIEPVKVELLERLELLDGAIRVKDFMQLQYGDYGAPEVTLPRKAKEWVPDPLQEGLNGIFKRRNSTKWSAAELKAYKLAAPDMDDLAQVVRFYRQTLPEDQPIKHRTSLLTLLNNWQGEVDKARGWRSGGGSGGKKPSLKVL